MEEPKTIISAGFKAGQFEITRVLFLERDVEAWKAEIDERCEYDN
jgi:hypothetical protein